VGRVAIGIPTSLKKIACPDGEQMQSNRSGLDEALWN